jgi:hypothetical protein
VKRAGVRVGVATQFVYDGELFDVVEVHLVAGVHEIVARELRTEAVRRFGLGELMWSDRARLLTDGLDSDVPEITDVPSSIKWSAASIDARRDARDRAAHVREALTGYRSGSSITAMPHEPRPVYDSSVAKGKRLEAKAIELNIGLRTLQRWVSQYETEGEVGLLSAKSIQQPSAVRDSRSSSRRHQTSCGSTSMPQPPRGT